MSATKFYSNKIQISLVHNLVERIVRYYNIHAERMLDIGCSNGSLTVLVANLVNASEVYGVDVSDKALEVARMRGVSTYRVDLNIETLPFHSGYFDLVMAIDIIEHLLNTDNLISEAYRVLRHGGYFIVSTPNLASWVNRIALLLGYQPFTSEVSFIGDFGKLKSKWYKGHISGHVRAYTLRALIEQVKYHGFEVIKESGGHIIHDNKILTSIGKLLAKRPNLAQLVVVLCRKP